MKSSLEGGARGDGSPVRALTTALAVCGLGALAGASAPDDGTPSLASYRRVIPNVTPASSAREQ